MASALKLFDFRRPRRVMARCVDAGSNGPGRMGHFVCKCGFDEWHSDCKANEIRRGIPCPNCNPTTAEPK